MDRREDYFARVTPLIGEGLRGRVVSLEQVSLTGQVIELLASCRLEEVILPEAPETVGWPLPISCRGSAGAPVGSAQEMLQRHLAWKNGFVQMRLGTSGEPDLVLKAKRLLPGELPRLEWDGEARTVTLCATVGDRWAFENLCYAAARQARDILLGRQAWPQKIVYHGNRGWPFAETAVPVSAPENGIVNLRGRHLLVIGCGSVGSEAVRLLSGSGARWTLVDPGTVSVFNPQRQWFSTDDIGRPKVEVLAERLSPESVRIVHDSFSTDNLEPLRKLLAADRPDLVLLTTGTADHDALASLLWGERISHVCAVAYPQARFFEVTVVLPAEGTPCLHCFRGNLFSGPAGTVPMSDEVANFLYRPMKPAEREAAYQNLVAEPAGRIETGRIAAVAAQCAAQALKVASARELWFQRLLAESTTCLLGGNVVERLGSGETAYGLTYPGQVVRLGLPDIAGAEERRDCGVCGRRLQVVHRLSLPATSEDEVDRALLS